LDSFWRKKFYRFFLYLFFIIYNLSPITIKADAHIFVYHRFDDKRFPSTNTSLKELKKEFEFFKKNNYKIIPLERLIDSIKTKKNIPDNWIVLTIDDGYRSFYKNALWLFKKYNYSFTLFISTKPSQEGWRDYMNWDEIKECAKYGEIALHSHSHPHLTHLSDEEIRMDTKKALEIFKKRLKKFPKYYAYPYGEYNERVKNIIKSFGFEAICNQNIGAVNKDSDIYDLDRIALTGKVNIEKKLKLKRLHLKYLKIQRKNNKIIKIFGELLDNVPYINIYLTDFGWKYHIKIKNHQFTFYPNFELKKFRNRVIIRYNYKIFSKMIIKY